MDEYSILRKKQKKNAFAATALLISIAIALLVMVGTVLVLSKVNDKDRITTSDNSAVTEKENKQDDEKEDNTSSTTCEGLVKEIVFNDNLKNIKEAAVSYFTNERLPQSVGDTKKITLKEMQDKKLVLNVRDASANTCSGDKSYVEVTKEENEYVMKVNLSCGDMEDYIIVHLGCYDYCDKDVCEKKEEKTYEYEYKKVTSCIMGDWSNWGNWQLNREKTSKYKKEDIKVVTSSKDVNNVIDAIANTSYNCDNYPGYELVGDKCVNETTVTSTIPATPSEYSYSCDKYPGYKLVGNECVKETTKKDIIDATKNPTTYSCPKDYKLDGKKCYRTVTKTETADGKYVCPADYKLDGTKCKKTTTTTDTKNATKSCPDGYKLNGTKCTKTTTKTETKDATPVYATRNKTEYYTCYVTKCTTKTVFMCPSGQSCGNYPQTSCEQVKSTCSRQVQEQYISKYTCPKGYDLKDKKCTKTTTTTVNKDIIYTCPKDYKLDGTKCKKTTTTTDTQNATFTCPDGFDNVNNTCVKKYKVKETIDATPDPDTYTCPSGYDLQDKKCVRTIVVKETKTPDRIPGGYVCPKDYTQNGKTCTKVTTNKDTKDAKKKVVYTCPKGYTKNDKTCTYKGTETIKTTYYRYATRSCNGGSTSYEWSTSKNDSILKSEGYKLTGNKREVVEK